MTWFILVSCFFALSREKKRGIFCSLHEFKFDRNGPKEALVVLTMFLFDILLCLVNIARIFYLDLVSVVLQLIFTFD